MKTLVKLHVCLIYYLVVLGIYLLYQYIFLFFSSPYRYEHVSPCVPFIAMWFFFFSLGALARAAFIDPGIVPRATSDEAAYIEKQIGTVS